MWLEAITEPVVYRWPGGQIRLEPGKLVILPQERAQRLLKKACGRVRIVHNGLLRSATTVYWERADGTIAGPAAVLEVGTEAFWICLRYNEEVIWVHCDRLCIDLGNYYQ